MYIYRLVRTVVVAVALISAFLLGFHESAPAEEIALPITISEIRIDQPGADNDEYFELVVAPGVSLDDLTYIVIGDGPDGSGVIEAVVPLTGQMSLNKVYYVVAEETFTLATANQTATLNFENGDNVTHMLVRGFSGAVDDDLDVEDDGTLDKMPWQALVDCVGLVATADSGDKLYCETRIGPDGDFVPGHVNFCEEGIRNYWQIGAFGLGEDDTPGAANHCLITQVKISEIRIDQPDADNDEYFELAGPVASGLSSLTYLVIGDGAGESGVIEAAIPLTGRMMASTGFFVVAEETTTHITANLTTSLNFENDDNVTHLLVQGFSGAVGDDLDAQDDGALDSTPWTHLVDCIGLVATVGSGDLLYCDTRIGPDGTFVPGHVYRCNEGWRIGKFALGEDDTPGAANVCPTGGDLGQCFDPATRIHAVQGISNVSPLAGQLHVLEGVVVGDFQNPTNALGGFFLQEEPNHQDGDTATSEGIFVFDNGAGVEVKVGDLVRVRGEVDEQFGMTQLENVTGATVCMMGVPSTPVALSLPVTESAILERYEGMLVTLPMTLTVTDNFNLGRFGEVDLAAGGRLLQPTNVVSPGTAANDLQAQNSLRVIRLDDGSNLQNPVPLPAYFAADGTLRAGDTTHAVTGTLGYGFGVYRIQPTQPVTFTRQNARMATPSLVGGSLKVASFNVLNYFTTLDGGSAICGPAGNLECRGADNATEFSHQVQKIVAALTAMDADVVGLMELENNAAASPALDGADPVLAHLVDALNASVGAGTYAFIDAGAIGTDAIKVALIHKAASVTPTGTFTILNSTIDTRFNDAWNRPVLVQTYAEAATGARFTVAVAHLKSKGSPCDDVGDPDVGDGQGNCNSIRTLAAQALVDWLATDPTGSGDPDVLIIGDLNAYALEDPVTAIRAGADDAAGTADDYTNLIAAFVGPDAYSYVFQGQAGYLDHTLANGPMLTQVAGVTEWHVNADEPRALDYNDFNQAELYKGDMYRSSDHDPLIVGLNLTKPGFSIYLPVIDR